MSQTSWSGVCDLAQIYVNYVFGVFITPLLCGHSPDGYYEWNYSVNELVVSYGWLSSINCIIPGGNFELDHLHFSIM